LVIASELNPMRMVSAAIVLPWLVGCAATPPAPTAQVELPYSACEPMADLRNNLTGTPYPSANSDAILHRLGVRCIGGGYPTLVRARY
jgi:type IV pilus biogenesis protein CpaD/CtpE